MKNIFYSSLSNIMVALVFILATKIASINIMFGIIIFIIAFICLDFHSYIDKELGYPNNLFIH